MCSVEDDVELACGIFTSRDGGVFVVVFSRCLKPETTSVFKC